MKRKRRVKFNLTLLVSTISAVMSMTAAPAFACDSRVQSAPYTVDSETHGDSVLSSAGGQVDDLGTYMENLGAFGKCASIPASSTELRDLKSFPRENERTPPSLNGEKLRAAFHSGEFNAVDTLGTYTEDLSRSDRLSANTQTRLEVEKTKYELQKNGMRKPSANAGAPSRPADLAFESSTDDLGTYMEELGAYATSAQFAATVSRRASTLPAPPRAAQPQRTVGLAALRAWMHSPEFTPIDDLGTYIENFTTRAVIVTASTVHNR